MPSKQSNFVVHAASCPLIRHLHNDLKINKTKPIFFVFLNESISVTNILIVSGVAEWPE
jgi:hypothetical protein